MLQYLTGKEVTQLCNITHLIETSVDKQIYAIFL